MGKSLKFIKINQPITKPLFFLSLVRPLQVEILEREQPLSVGRETELACRAIGARPPAVITWWLNDRQLHVTDEQKVRKLLYYFFLSGFMTYKHAYYTLHDFNLT